MVADQVGALQNPEVARVIHVGAAAGCDRQQVVYARRYIVDDPVGLTVTGVVPNQQFVVDQRLDEIDVSVATERTQRVAVDVPARDGAKVARVRLFAVWLSDP